MKTSIYVILLTMFFLWLSGLSLAQKSEVETEDLLELSFESLLDMEVTSVSKKAESLQAVPSSIYVITTRDIEHSSAQNLMQLLRDNVPGFWGVANDYKNADAFIRNTYEGSVLVQLDGTPLLEVIDFTLDYESFDIPFSQIERIEVIKGSGGSVYGANSASGIISIYTKNPEDRERIIASLDYAFPGKTDVNLIATPVKNEIVAATIYGKYSYFSGFDQMSIFEDKTSVVPASHTNGDVTITNRYTEDDNSFNSLSGGYKLSYKSNKRLTISSAGHVVSTMNDKYFQLFSRKYGTFRLEDNMIKPSAKDSVFLSENNKTRLVAHLRADYTISDIHSIFGRISTNYESKKLILGGGYETNAGFIDFEVQDNVNFGINQLSLGGNYRMVNYDVRVRDDRSIQFINPQTNESLVGVFAQNKMSLLDNTINLYIGLKAENFSLINNKFYLSPMAKFVIIPNKKVSIWGGFTQSYTTPGFNQTNIELDLFRAPSSSLYPYYYAEVQQMVFDGAYHTALEGGLDELTATEQAQGYIESEEGKQQIDALTNQQLDNEYPGGNVNITAINGPETEPTSFSNLELGIRWNPFARLSFESNFFYSAMKNGIGNSPTDVAVLPSLTRPGEMIQAYYYGNYFQGHNTGLESIVKYQAMDNLLFELSHSWYSYGLEYQKNDDFDIEKDISEKQRDLVNDKYPQLPEHVFRAKAYYEMTEDFSISISSVYTTAFYVKYGTVNPTYQYDMQRFDPLYGDGGYQELIGGEFDNRFILNVKINKQFFDHKLNVYLYGYDITSSPFVEGVNQLATIYPRQVGSMFGAGIQYKF